VNLGRAAWVGAWIVGLVLLHYTLRPLLGWRVQVDFLVIALLVVAVRARPGVAAFCGFALGIVTDSLGPAAFGAGALAMTVVAFASSWLKAAFFTENVGLNALFVFGGKWVFDVLYVVGERRLHGADLAVQFFWWSPLAAVLTAVAGTAVLMGTRTPVARVRR
jgi:rod shape-determining protein MreD